MAASKKGLGMRPDDLRAYRNAQGLTQSEFAQWLSQALGRKYDHSRVSNWERGTPIPAIVERHIRMHPVIPAGEVGPAFYVAVSNNKGGAAKSTTTTNLGALLADKGRETLIVDCDAQANVSVHLGIDVEQMQREKRTIEFLLSSESTVDHCIVPTSIAGLSIIPASLHLYKQEEALQRAYDRRATKEAVAAAMAAEGSAEERAAMVEALLDDMERKKDEALVTILRTALEPIRDRFDFVLMDTPPGLGLIARNALAAGDVVLIPSRMERLSTMGLNTIVDAVSDMAVEHNPGIDILGIVPTMYRAGLNQDRQTLEEVSSLYGATIHIFPPVPLSVKYPESAASAVALLHHVPRAPGSETFDLVANALIEERNRRLPAARQANANNDVAAADAAE